MNYKEIQDLIKLINKTDISEFKFKQGEFELTVRTKEYHKGKPSAIAPQQVISVPTPTPVAAISSFSPPPINVPEVATSPAAQQTTPQKEGTKAVNSTYKELKSPIVGTFYRSASPDKPPYIKVGDRIESGSVVCIVEAMNLQLNMTNLYS